MDIERIFSDKIWEARWAVNKSGKPSVFDVFDVEREFD